MAILHPEKYVMKPQREGGGNNIYGLDVKTTLESIKNSKVRTGYILMEYIDAPRQKNYLLGPNNEDICLQELISELGIYGIIIGYCILYYFINTKICKFKILYKF